MTFSTKNFILNNRDLIDENTKESWEEIYEKLNYELEIVRSEFTETLINSNINPVSILKYIPPNYLENSNIRNYTIPKGTKTICKNAFNSSKIESIVIPDSVKSIENGAFAYCSELTHIELGPNINNIGAYAFKECSSLSSIKIPEKIVFIRFGSFQKCDSLKNITIENGAQIIETFAFAECKNLEKIVIPDSVKAINSHVFQKCDNLKKYRL